MPRNLSVGMSGMDVKAIQQALNIWMPDRKPLVDDGKFGPLTKAAVIAFQSRRNLTRDGIVGPFTLTALYPVAPYYGFSVVARGVGPSAAAPQSAVTSLRPAAPGSLVLERIPGIPVPVPVPQAPANTLANVPGLPPQPRRVAQPSPPSPGGVKFQSTQYQFGTTATWPLDFSKPGVVAVQVAVKGLFLLHGRALTLSVGGTGSLAVTDGAKDSAAAIGQIAWAPAFLNDRLADLASLSLIAQVGAGVSSVLKNGKDAPPAFFHQEALNLKLGLDHNRYFLQAGVTLSQDSKTGNLGLHAPNPGFGVAAGFAF